MDWGADRNERTRGGERNFRGGSDFYGGRDRYGQTTRGGGDGLEFNWERSKTPSRLPDRFKNIADKMQEADRNRGDGERDGYKQNSRIDVPRPGWASISEREDGEQRNPRGRGGYSRGGGGDRFQDRFQEERHGRYDNKPDRPRTDYDGYPRTSRRNDEYENRGRQYDRERGDDFRTDDDFRGSRYKQDLGFPEVRESGRDYPRQYTEHDDDGYQRRRGEYRPSRTDHEWRGNRYDNRDHFVRGGYENSRRGGRGGQDFTNHHDRDNRRRSPSNEDIDDRNDAER